MDRSIRDKRTVERLLEMIHLLGGGRVWSVHEMAERFDVSERTVYRDLSRLEQARIPVVHWDGGYRLSPDARMRPLSLTAEERATLAIALDTPALRANELQSRRADLLRGKLSAGASQEQFPASSLAGPERTGPVPHVILETLEMAIHSCRVVEMDYVSLSSGARRREVEPWRLVHRDSVWYLAAYCRENRELRFFRADRIERVRMRDDPFQPPDPARVDETLRSSWSIYQGETVHQIVIRFDPDLAPLVEHARHHESEQVECLETGEVEYRVELTHLDEIARWILGFGGRARAVAPEALRERVRELAEGTLAVHTKRRGPKRADEQNEVRQVRQVRRQTGQTSPTGPTK